MNRRYDSSQAWSADELAGADLRMETPSRTPSIAADLLVPLGQALVTGALIAGLVAFVSKRAGYDGDAGALWVGLALFIGAVTWFFLLVDTRRLLRTIENLTGLDIDGDGQAGTVRERYISVNAPQARAEAAQIAQEAERAEVACELSEFVSRIPHVGTDMRTWVPRIGQERYTAFRALLLEMGWATWNSTRDKRKGWRLVLPVREILQRIRDEE